MTLSVVVKFLLPALWNPRIGPERPLSTEDLLRRFLDSDFGRRHIPDPAMIDESASVEQPATAPDGPMEVAARTAWETMREVSWTASRHGTRPESAGPAAWDSEVIDAIERAVSLSLGAGLPRVGMAQVVLGLLADPRSAASRLVERSGGWRDLVVQELRARFEESGHNVAWVPAVDSLLMLGQLRSRLPVLRVVFGAPIAWGLRRRGSSASLSVLAEEAARQAVRHGRWAVDASDVFLALPSLGHQLAVSGSLLRRRLHQDAACLAVLAEFGITSAAAAQWMEDVDPPPATAARKPIGADEPADPPWTERAVETLEVATGLAREAGDRNAGFTHVALALLDDAPHGIGVRLDAAGVDRAAVRRRLLG